MTVLRATANIFKPGETLHIINKSVYFNKFIKNIEYDAVCIYKISHKKRILTDTPISSLKKKCKIG